MRRRLAAAVSCGVLLLSACGNGVGVQSTSASTLPDPGREFLITTTDALTLEARAWGDGPDYVVLAHMRPADMTSWFDFARLLGEEGYTAVAFNFRGYGGSDGNEGEFDVDADIRGAVAAALGDGAAKVFVIGASMGGTGAIAAAADNHIAGVVALSAPPQFEGVNAVRKAGRVDAPMLLIAADGDGDAADDALEIASAARIEPQVEVLSGTQHGTNLLAEHGTEITELVLDFLAAG